MKKWKEALIFSLLLIPVAAIGGYCTMLYQLDHLDQEMVDQAVAQVGSLEAVVAITVMQTVLYALVCGFFGHILANQLGLIRPFRLDQKALVTTLALSLIGGILFSLDYWTFGAWIPGVREATDLTMSVHVIVASLLYGGVVEEVMLRLFMMSLIAFLLWKIFFRKREQAPQGVIIAANVIAALLFAAVHLPATIMLFGELTPLIVFRCFLLNGGFGLLFGWLFRKYGIGYAMLSHALLHIISKLIWLLFV